MAKKASKTSFGMAEWYGHLYRTLDDAQRKALVGVSRKSQTCPHLRDSPNLAPKAGTHCSKDGGVCSLRSFTADETAPDGVSFGEITATCPNRFLEGQTIIREIGARLLDTSEPLIAKEVPFLMRNAQVPEIELEEDSEADENLASEPDREDVGRIDLVFMHPEKDPMEWCAVEMQAVYFSGKKMSADIDVIKSYHGNGIPMPGGSRRPDFRSSGPKRLMPQLQIKVPTLRRWGKKMVVVVDKPFFESLGEMERVSHISNCDIVWVVVRFDEGPDQLAHLVVDEFLYTSLESAVEGLTAGHPTTLPAFEESLRAKTKPKKRKKA